MATLRFRGDAQARRQATWVQVANVEVGDVFKFTINRKDIEITAAEYRTFVNGTWIEDPAHSVYSQLATAINGSTIAEFDELFGATAEFADQDGNYSAVLPAINYNAVKISGPLGVPFTISGATTDSSGIPVQVSTIQEGSAGQNEKQRYAFAATPSGGTYTLTFQGQTTGAINYNASTATITTALEALSNIAPGDVTVTGSYTTAITIEFKGAYANTPVQLMTGSGASLTGACSISVATPTEGAPSQNFIQTLTFQQAGVPIASGYITLTKPGAASQNIFIDSNLSHTQFYDNYLGPYFGYANVSVSYPVNETKWFIEFTGIYAGLDTAFMTSLDDEIIIETDQPASSTGIDEVQVLTLLGGPTGGTFTLTFQGQTTAGIAYNAAASAVQSALEALSNIAPGDVVVTLLATGVYQCAFAATLGDQNLQQMTGSAASLTGGSVYFSRIQQAASPANEVQLVTVAGNATGGTFTLTYSGQTTGGIDWDASAADITTALEALSNIGVGDVVVSGDDGGPWTVRFQGALASTNVSQMTASGALLTGGGGTQTVTITTTINATGPNWWDDAENWDTNTAPVTGDTVIIENTSVPILYGLDQSAVTLAALHIKATFTGTIGLPDINEEWLYYEYREKYLKIGATLCVVGAGDGEGATLIRLNYGSVQNTTVILTTGNAAGADPVVHLLGTHASNSLNVTKGSVAIAIYAGQVSTFATINCGFQSGQGEDVTLLIGSGVTFATVNMSGGLVLAETGGTGTWTQTGGEATINGTGGHSGQIILQKDAVLHWNNTGTLGSNLIIAGDAHLDFDQDMRTKTVTNPIERQSATSKITDNFQVVSNLRIDNNYTEMDSEFLQLGSNLRITRGTPA